jgi:signal transduction histidine kinase
MEQRSSEKNSGNLAHEAKNCLTAIIAVSNILKQEFKTSKSIQEYVEILERNSEKLLQITETLLENKKN